MPAVHAEEGCLLYAIHAASDGTVVMIEKWAEPAAPPRTRRATP
jgi:quinol monooxygenase YgiN